MKSIRLVLELGVQCAPPITAPWQYIGETGGSPNRGPPSGLVWAGRKCWSLPAGAGAARCDLGVSSKGD
jgi:hypothetical protein